MRTPPEFAPSIRTNTRTFAGNSPDRSHVTSPYHDLVEECAEAPVAGGTQVFVQHNGPFTSYRRVVAHDTDGRLTERTSWSLDAPCFNWLFRPLVALHFRRRRHGQHRPWWAPPQTLDAREVLVLALLAASSMASAFINTLFTQTVTFAADGFGISERGQGVAAAIVRLGIVLAIPLAVLGDRLGRRRIVVTLSFVAPIAASFGALAPNFAALVGTQTIARPLGLALDVAVLVIVVEEMPKHARAYGLSLLAMASGLGAGVAVVTLPLADVGDNGWRLVYVVALVWLSVAVRIRRRLTETKRFERARERSLREAVPATPLGRQRRAFVLVLVVAFLGNIFVATASIFQNRYLKDVREYSATMIALFTLLTVTPSGLGLVLGGRLADDHGRRKVAAVCVPVGATLLALSFATTSFLMWGSALLGGIVAATAYPAMAVYRGELFPTKSRTTSSFLVTVSALLGGSIGLVLGGSLVDGGWSYGSVMFLFASAALVVAALVWFFYPETAHRELEELNPQDA